MRILYYISILFLASCAQQVPPSGGPKDTLPPEVIAENTFPRNGSVNFNSKTIIIAFTEFVKLNNPGENIIISPAMAKKPEFSLKGKKLFIELKSELKPNTTYTINFGNSITDITENNPAAGLTYVFSTGTFIDSLKISGTVTNAFTNAPEKNVWVLLHKNSSDTSFQKNVPDYLAKTDADGNYLLQNLSAGEYKIYALKDGNSDYKYSQPSEEIAFHSETIIVGENNPPVNLKLFNESSEKQYVKSSRFVWPGKLQMVMNKSYGDWYVTILPYDTMTRSRSATLYKNAFGDTIDVWLRNAPTENGTEIKVAIVLDKDSLNKKIDTVEFRVSGVKETIPSMKLKHNANKSFGLYDKLKLKFDRPAFLFRPENLRLYKNDTVFVEEKTSVLGYGVSLINVWEEKTDYTLILEDSAFADVFFKQYSKADTIRFSTVKKDSYGNISANVEIPEGVYQLQLIGPGEKVETQVLFNRWLESEGERVREFSSPDVKFENLKPGNYKLRLFQDTNENGKWDTGNLKENKQPERVWYYKEIITIRSNWDFDLNWKIEN